jgi:hypothetical protein
MATLSTSAWILHDLGMAAGFGGTLFGTAALDPAVRQLDSREQRGRVLDSAWGRFEVVDALALGAMAATWWSARSALSGKLLGRSVRRLVLAKDVLIGATFLTGVAGLVAGRVLRREHRRVGPAVPASEPATTPTGRNAQRVLRVIGPLNTALAAGAIGVNAALAQASGRSARWTALARLLP